MARRHEAAVSEIQRVASAAVEPALAVGVDVNRPPIPAPSIVTIQDFEPGRFEPARFERAGGSELKNDVEDPPVAAATESTVERLPRAAQVVRDCTDESELHSEASNAECAAPAATEAS
jgi:hypothetical protein